MPRLMVCLRDDRGKVRSSVCELPAAFTGVGAITIHFGDWHPSSFVVHATPTPMDRRKHERRSGTEGPST